MSLKTLLIVLDGLGDRLIPELDGKTPLEYAQTPHLDTLAQRSETGIIYTLEPGYCMNTDLAHLILFGYSATDYPGRAVIDLLGENIAFKDEQLILRTSWANAEGTGPYLLKERFVPELSHFNALTLGDCISGDFEGHTFDWHFSHDSHGFLLIDGPQLSSDVSDSDPFYKDQYVMAVEPQSEERKAIYTADLLNRYLKSVAGVLHQHELNQKRVHSGQMPANMLLTKWAGMAQKIDAFEVQNGMTSKLIAGSKLLRGISEYIKMPFEMEKNFEVGLEKALASNADFVCLHTKAPDEAAHSKEPFAKVKVLEALDPLLRPLLSMDLDQWQVVITSDHSTPSTGDMIHSGEYVPILFYGKNMRPDQVTTFAERSCINGTHRLRGKDLMPLILNYADRGNLYHLRHGKKHRLYRPVHVNPLK